MVGGQDDAAGGHHQLLVRLDDVKVADVVAEAVAIVQLFILRLSLETEGKAVLAGAFLGSETHFSVGFADGTII